MYHATSGTSCAPEVASLSLRSHSGQTLTKNNCPTVLVAGVVAIAAVAHEPFVDGPVDAPSDPTDEIGASNSSRSDTTVANVSTG